MSDDIYYCDGVKAVNKRWIATHYLDVQYFGPSKRLAGWIPHYIKYCDALGELLFQITLALSKKTISLGSMHGRHQTTVGVTSADQ
jgi:hypothetical protein